MFKNLRLFRIRSPWPADEEGLASQLAETAFVPCGPYSEQSSGWEPPTGVNDTPLARRVNGADLMCLRTQLRLLPAAAITEALEERLNQFEASTGEPANRRETRRLKNEVRDELLPQALLKSERIRGFYLPGEEILAVDSAAAPKAERFVGQLRAAFGSIEAVPLKFAEPVAPLLNEIFLNDSHATLKLGRECRMRDPSDSRVAVTWAGMDLADRSIRSHVADGLEIEKLGIDYGQVMSFVMDQTGAVTKLKFVGMEADADLPDDDPIALLDAEFVLLAGTVQRLLGELKSALGGYA